MGQHNLVVVVGSLPWKEKKKLHDSKLASLQMKP
jgi:hypothetical protein